jgi:hypothetical protein
MMFCRFHRRSILLLTRDCTVSKVIEQRQKGQQRLSCRAADSEVIDRSPDRYCVYAHRSAGYLSAVRGETARTGSPALARRTVASKATTDRTMYCMAAMTELLGSMCIEDRESG